MKTKNLLNSLPDNTNELREKQQDLMADANPALKAKVHWVVNWCKQETKNSLLSRWELGEQINEVFRDHSENGCKRYGSKAFQTIAAFSGEAEGSLRICAKLAKSYVRGQIVDISEMIMADGVTPLSFSHIRCVLALDNPSERQEALNMALERCWTVDSLNKYVLSKMGGGNSAHKGRPVAKPKDVEGVIAQQMSFAADFNKRNTNVWQDPKHSISAHLAKIPTSMYTEDMAAKLCKLAQQLRALADDVGVRADEAEKKYEEVRHAVEAKLTNGVKMASELTEEKEEVIEKPTAVKKAAKVVQ
jgi:hypothetical protein